MGSIERIHAVAARVAKSHKQGDQIVVAVSAMSGETNRLIGLAKEIEEQPAAREMDVLVSTGGKSLSLCCVWRCIKLALKLYPILEVRFVS